MSVLRRCVDDWYGTTPREELQMHAYTRDIFEETVDQDFLHKNSALRVMVPKNLRETDTTTLI